MQQQISLPTLTLVHSKEINVECNQQSSKLCAATGEILPIESAVLLEQEERWLAECEYFEPHTTSSGVILASMTSA